MKKLRILTLALNVRKNKLYHVKIGDKNEPERAEQVLTQNE